MIPSKAAVLKALVKIVDLTKFNPTDACQITRIEQNPNPAMKSTDRIILYYHYLIVT